MKIIAAITILSALTFSATYAQSSPHQLGKIRRVPKLKKFKDRPAIEIAVTGPHNVGGLYYCLRIGKLAGIPESGVSPEGESMYFYLSMEDWKKLKNGSPVWLTWGCFSESMYEQIKPLAYLNKRLLAKD